MFLYGNTAYMRFEKFRGSLNSGKEQHICRQIASFSYNSGVKPSNTHQKAEVSPSTCVQLWVNYQMVEVTRTKCKSEFCARDSKLCEKCTTFHVRWDFLLTWKCWRQEELKGKAFHFKVVINMIQMVINFKSRANEIRLPLFYFFRNFFNLLICLETLSIDW